MAPSWEWQDDDASWKKYAPATSAQIEGAMQRGIKKFFFSKNGNSYSLDFKARRQCNVKTGKQRSVRPVPLALSSAMKAKAKESERGPFGAGLYWYEYAQMALQMAKQRSESNKGQLVK